MSAAIAAGLRIGDRYRLERPLSSAAAAGQGDLWQGRDELAQEAPVVLRRIPPERDQARARQVWARLQGVLHPQIPRFGAAISDGDQLWLVRDWQNGRTYRELLEARRERQLVFGAGEVLLLLRQLLPVLAALHGQELLHGDLCPANLLRRDSDGLPVLLDFGLVRLQDSASGAGSDAAEAAPAAATPGYAPPELLRGEPAMPWMDLHALGVVALVLLSGDEPGGLLDPLSLAWRWPATLEGEPGLRSQLGRLLGADGQSRFRSASQALQAFQALPMPDSTGPVPRADRTLALVPPEPALTEPGPSQAGGSADGTALPDDTTPGASTIQDAIPGVAAAAGEAGGVSPADGDALAGAGPAAALAAVPDASDEDEDTDEDEDEDSLNAERSRPGYVEREEAAEGGLWPVLIALVLSAIVGTALGWWALSRDRPGPSATGQELGLPQGGSLPPSEVDQRQQLLNRLRALQVDRGWFLRLVDASLLAQYPEQKGRLPGAGPEDAPLRKVWNDLADDWLARVEQLPLELRSRLGRFGSGDWERSQKQLVAQGLSPVVLQQLVSGSAQNLLPGSGGQEIPPEPFRQLWYAAAQQVLAELRLDPIVATSREAQIVSAEVPANGVRLFAIRLPASHALVLGVNGTPLVQMSVYGADGKLLEERGPLRVVSLPRAVQSPVQLLLSNGGVAPAMIRLSLRADPPPQAPAEPPPPPAGPGATLVPLEPGQESSPEPSAEGSSPASPSPGSDSSPTSPDARTP
ncbi:MAG: phosphotransferase [Synechococcaceae cyanobacterium]|nr:phosphotransferase [Synechococcaceae cyanobacterium]